MVWRLTIEIRGNQVYCGMFDEYHLACRFRDQALEVLNKDLCATATIVAFVESSGRARVR